jgi:signal transduction histidine kinase
LIVIAALVPWVIAGRMLRPLRTITAGARRMTGERLHERLALTGPQDEIKDLGDTFDAMLARLEVAFQDQQLFAANAAHELRTPLGVMHAELDLALSEEQAPEQRQMLLRLKRTVVACERLTERLLSLTYGQLAATDRRPVSLDGVVAERLALVDPAAQRLTVESDLQPVVADGDPALLAQLVENLIENATKYNVPDGRIEVRVRGESGQAILEVSNSGPKLDQDELAGLLEPFRRAAQQRVGTGNGLGLSIVRTIVAAHDGQLALNALADGGLRVTVKLPSTPEQPTTGAVAPGGNPAIAASLLRQSEIRRSAS